MSSRYLLDLTVGGQVLRVATTPATVTAADGTSLVYSEGLSVSAPAALATAVSATIIAEPDGVSWAQRIADGQQVEGGRVALWLHEDGQDLDEATMLLGGYATQVRWGAPGSPLSLTIDAVPPGIGGTMPPAEAVTVEGVNWPIGANILNSEDTGLVYPVVFGYPGGHQSDTYMAYRVPLVNINTSTGEAYWLLAEHDIAATDVEVTKYDTSAKPGTQAQTIASVLLFDDDLGRATKVAYQSSAITTPYDGVEYWCGHPLTDGGGMISARGGVVREAGEVLERLLVDYGEIPVDSARMRAATERLSGYLLDGAVTEPIDVWEYIERAILPLLPVRVRWSDKGMYLAVVEYDPNPASVVAYLDAQRQDVTRTSDPSARFDLLNQHRIDYGYARGRHELHRALTGDPSANAETWYGELSPWMLGDIYCLRSQSRYGLREAEPITTAVVWDDATATRILRWKARMHALPIWGVQYVGGTEWRHLEPGDVVELTDSALAWSSRLAVVEDAMYGLSETVLELSVVPDLGG